MLSPFRLWLCKPGLTGRPATGALASDFGGGNWGTERSLNIPWDLRALGFYCGFSLPPVTTRQHCLFSSSWGLSSLIRRQVLGVLLFGTDPGSWCQGTWAPYRRCGTNLCLWCWCAALTHLICIWAICIWRGQSGVTQAVLGAPSSQGRRESPENEALKWAVFKILVYRVPLLLVYSSKVNELPVVGQKCCKALINVSFWIAFLQSCRSTGGWLYLVLIFV